MSYPHPGESDRHYRARLKAEEKAAQEYEKLSEPEKDLYDQRAYWDASQAVFIVKVQEQISLWDIQRRAWGLLKGPVRTNPEELTVVGSAPEPLSKRYLNQIEPLAWLKGRRLELKPWYLVYRNFGYMCDFPSHLDYATKGDLLVVYTFRGQRYREDGIIRGPLNGEDMFAIDAKEAVDPRVTKALAAFID